MKKKPLLAIALFGLSLAAYLLIAPLRGAGIEAWNLTGTGIASFVSFVLYFFLTVYCLKHFSGRLSVRAIVLSLIAGAAIVEIVVRSIHFSDTLITLPEGCIRIIAILNGAFYYLSRRKAVKTTVTILLFALTVWYAACGSGQWIRFLDRNRCPANIGAVASNRPLVSSSDEDAPFA